MSLLQRRQKRERGNGNALAKTSPEGGALAPARDYRQQFERAIDRLWREFERNPFTALRALPSQMGSLTDWPAIDIAEDEKAITLRVDVPGLNPQDVDVEVSGNLLTIRGQRADEWTDRERGVRVRERVFGSFARTIALPSYVDARQIDARYARGTLTITIPKIQGQGPKRVPVSQQQQSTQGQSAQQQRSSQQRQPQPQPQQQPSPQRVQG